MGGGPARTGRGGRPRRGGLTVDDAAALLLRIAQALERLAPAAPDAAADLGAARLHRFDGRTGRFAPAPDFALPLDLLVGVERQKAELVRLVERFADGASTNHALLWGARGAGKSALVKAAVNAVGAGRPSLKLVQVAADDLAGLPALFARLEGRPERVVLLCDDLSFEEGAAGAKALKSVLEGGVAGPPENVLIVATSNRRHLMPRGHEDGGRDADRLAASEDADETLSMSDRFGVWLGFPPMDQPTYLAAVRAYAERYALAFPDLERRALQWSQRRGARSGRVAVQFIREVAGELGRPRPL